MSVLHVPEAIVSLAATLEEAGYETWCVGGAVRDALLGHPHFDWDLATAAAPEQVQRLFRRTIPVGIKFGTVGVLDRDGRMHEVTTFRRDMETDGRHAVVKFGASLDEDLARRDLTINAIAYSPSRDVLHDPFGGRGDLNRRVIRAVGNPAERMREDRLRALRAIRFSARLNFAIDAATWSAIVASAPHLGRLSAERVLQELEKTMEQVVRPSEALERWNASGALRALIPALTDPDPTLLRALDHLPTPGLLGRPQRRINRLAALFLGVEASQLDKTLGDLRFSNQAAAWISDLVRHWRALGDEMDAALMSPSMLTGGQLRRWAARSGRVHLGPLVRIGCAVWSARRAAGLPAPDAARIRSAYRMLLRSAYRDPIEMADLAVDGGDLIDAGIRPGPRLGKFLRALLEVVIDDPRLNTRDMLLARALELSRRSPDSDEEY